MQVALDVAEGDINDDDDDDKAVDGDGFAVVEFAALFANSKPTLDSGSDPYAYSSSKRIFDSLARFAKL